MLTSVLERLYTPKEPAYFQAKQRDLKDIVTYALTEEVRGRHARGFEAQTPPDKAPVIVDGGEKERPKEAVSIRSFVEARCPSLLKGSSQR